MKTILCSLLALSLLATAQADIHDPPGADYGPTRKLGRGLSNIVFGITELPVTIATVNEREGNSAAASYGIVRGVGRVLYRFGRGVGEVATFPFPTYKGRYTPPYKSNVRWINAGYAEFPPELGFESRYHYTRSYNQ